MNSADMELKAENEARKYRLEDLELLHVLGRGNSGVVHKAKHRKTGQFIALKVRAKSLYFCPALFSFISLLRLSQVLTLLPFGGHS